MKLWRFRPPTPPPAVPLEPLVPEGMPLLLSIAICWALPALLLWMSRTRSSKAEAQAEATSKAETRAAPTPEERLCSKIGMPISEANQAEVLDLSDKQLSPAEATVLADLLEPIGGGPLTSVNVDGFALVVGDLCGGSAGNRPEMEEGVWYDAYNKGLGPASGVLLGRLIAQPSTLTKLIFWTNRLGDEGARAIVAGLTHNKTVTELDLAKNGIGLPGAQVHKLISPGPSHSHHPWAHTLTTPAPTYAPHQHPGVGGHDWGGHGAAKPLDLGERDRR